MADGSRHLNLLVAITTHLAGHEDFDSLGRSNRMMFGIYRQGEDRKDSSMK